jgi:hypothetical protein
LMFFRKLVINITWDEESERRNVDSYDFVFKSDNGQIATGVPKW